MQSEFFGELVRALEPRCQPVNARYTDSPSVTVLRHQALFCRLCSTLGGVGIALPVVLLVHRIPSHTSGSRQELDDPHGI